MKTLNVPPELVVPVSVALKRAADDKLHEAINTNLPNSKVSYMETAAALTKLAQELDR